MSLKLRGKTEKSMGQMPQQRTHTRRRTRLAPPLHARALPRLTVGAEPRRAPWRQVTVRSSDLQRDDDRDRIAGRKGFLERSIQSALQFLLAVFIAGPRLIRMTPSASVPNVRRRYYHVTIAHFFSPAGICMTRCHPRLFARAQRFQMAELRWTAPSPRRIAGSRAYGRVSRSPCCHKIHRENQVSMMHFM